ncbi:MAG: hypothetical protein NTY35_01405 [Planctomycetota bacterium]|nr:hypothetical protein [Planctomycetota bacterium]
MYSPRFHGSGTPSALVPLLAATLLIGFGCSSGNEPVKLTPGQAAAANANAGGNAATARPSAMTGDPHAGALGAAGSQSKPGGSLQFTVPEGWIVQTPTSAMRKAQFQLPKAANEPDDAQLILYYFGGEGGSKDDNLKRWAGQFVQPDGRSSQEVLVTSTRTVNGMNVTEASITGTFDAEMMPGQGDRTRRENWRMLAAIVETPTGPYYAKLMGPLPTVTRWEASFRQWVSSLHPSKG